MARRRRSPAVTAGDPPLPLPRRSRRRLTAADDAATAAVPATDALTAVTSSPSPLAPRIDAGADWSGLLPEILHLISLFLTNIWDYLRFRAVCTSWRSSCTASPPQIPSLLLPYDPDTTAHSFLDPSDFRVHTINIPEARGKWIYGTPHGWLVMLSKNYEHFNPHTCTLLDVSLLNPITRDYISLPPLPRYWLELPCIPETSGRFTRHIKPFLTANPNSSSSGDFLALLFLNVLALCRIGADAWTAIYLYADDEIVVDFTYFNGAFYVVNATRGITVINATTLKKKYTAPPPRPPPPSPFLFKDNSYLVESSGDLLLIERSCENFGPVTYVSKLDTSGTMLKWTRIEDSIGDRALFVSYNRSSTSLSSGDYLRSRGDLICFAGRDSCKDDYANTVANMSISDIVAGSSTGKQRYWQDSKGACRVSNSLLGLTWFIPSLH